MIKKPISSDSHITEPPNCYIDFIDPKFRDRAPRMVDDGKGGDAFYVEGIKRPINVGLAAAAGKDPKDLRGRGVKFQDLWRGGWDGNARCADQDRDGVCAEIIYPTVGMMLCNHDDFDYKKACFDAYNRWLQTFVAPAPKRIFGLGQIAMRSVEEGIKELEEVKKMGFVGVMMPGNPAVEDYDSPIYDPFWQAAVDLKMPLSFHILTAKAAGVGEGRGPAINSFLSIIRGNQDILGMMIFSGVFDRNPKLKIVCVEADAGWAPHFMYRADHAYKRHRFWMKGQELKKLPSECFNDHIYLTFQDDWIAFKMKHMVNIERLMWANDFPHSDSTWPWSQEILAEHTKGLTEEERNKICFDNVKALYNLPVEAQPLMAMAAQ
ncbi:MAG TPA: amidohydrolase family protein [Alphaproteobacteria bacterium]|nr:amidohydrolase family protein [Alphaproteobacteria bacterium]